ncbi:hypothetical protein HMPREF1568_0077 [Providencia alcalifaciens PAL-3]|nr:hypothetical protein HMPREF1568_0077 [Providencia alcalifaciens PAL-3]EUD00851.1 hypothetical protein HMPREF1566_2667 [Providencia alcalifaciens PAL-1]
MDIFSHFISLFSELHKVDYKSEMSSGSINKLQNHRGIGNYLLILVAMA